MTDCNEKQELRLKKTKCFASKISTLEFRFQTKRTGEANIKIKKLLPNESSFDILSLLNYFFLRKVSTSSGVIMLSTKVYAPVFGDLTILIALVNLFEAVCNVATVFFAMIQMYIEILLL